MDWMRDEFWFNYLRGTRDFPFCWGMGLTQPATAGASLVKSDRDAGSLSLLSCYTASRHGIPLSGYCRLYHLSPLGVFVLYLLQWLSQSVKPLAPTLAVPSLANPVESHFHLGSVHCSQCEGIRRHAPPLIIQ